MATKKKWSAEVTRHSDALDLDKDVFKQRNAAKVAHSLERSADKSTRKKSNSYRSAMSMLTFYINRAGKNLPESQKKILERAKEILRQDHEKTAAGPQSGTAARSQPKSTARSQSKNTTRSQSKSTARSSAGKRGGGAAKPQTRSAPRPQRSSK
jgi:putative cell wall-binding protein